MSGARLAWADSAKGGCILLVVLWHVTVKDYLQLPWSSSLLLTGAWGLASQVLLPVRMPLFFAISGLFAARLLDQPWRAVLTRRSLPLLWVFVLWTLVQTPALWATPGFDTAVAHNPGDLLVQLSITPGNLWYLEALASYVVVARATRRAPYVALAAALALSTVAAAGWVATPGNRYGLLTNLVWFLLGTRLLHLGRPSWRLPSLLLGPVAVIGFVVAAALWRLLDADAVPGVRPLLGLLGIGAGASGAAALSRLPTVGPALAALGRRTLPVYVLHLPLVALVHLASAHLVVGRVATWSPLGAVYPAVVTVLVVAACLLVHRLLLRVGAGWAFTAPWLGRPLSRVAVPAPLSAARGRMTP